MARFLHPKRAPSCEANGLYVKWPRWRGKRSDGLCFVCNAVAAILILMFAGLLPTSGGTERSKTRPARSTAPFVLMPSSRAPELITLAKFNQLQQGISYQEAVRIMGKEGTVMSESSIANIYTVMYSWQSNGIGNMNAIFQNGRMINKAQFGLK